MKQADSIKARAVILFTVVTTMVPVFLCRSARAQANGSTAANTNTPTQSVCIPERLLVPGGIATHDGSIGFFPTDGGSGIVALKLSDGKELWKTQRAQITIGVVGSSLVALSDGPRVHLFDNQGKELVVSADLPNQNLPTAHLGTITAQLEDKVFQFYSGEACGDENKLIVQWSAFSPGVGPGAIMPGKSGRPAHIETAVVLIDRHTGKVTPAEGISFSLPDDKSLSRLSFSVEDKSLGENALGVCQSRAFGARIMYLFGIDEPDPSIPYRHGTRWTIQMVDSSSRRTVWQRRIFKFTDLGQYPQPP